MRHNVTFRPPASVLDDDAYRVLICSSTLHSILRGDRYFIFVQARGMQISVAILVRRSPLTSASAFPLRPRSQPLLSSHLDAYVIVCNCAARPRALPRETDGSDATNEDIILSIRPRINRATQESPRNFRIKIQESSWNLFKTRRFVKIMYSRLCILNACKTAATWKINDVIFYNLPSLSFYNFYKKKTWISDRLNLNLIFVIWWSRFYAKHKTRLRIWLDFYASIGKFQRINSPIC